MNSAEVRRDRCALWARAAARNGRFAVGARFRCSLAQAFGFDDLVRSAKNLAALCEVDQVTAEVLAMGAAMDLRRFGRLRKPGSLSAPRL
jgi:hypothetical protein